MYLRNVIEIIERKKTRSEVKFEPRNIVGERKYNLLITSQFESKIDFDTVLLSIASFYTRM